MATNQEILKLVLQFETAFSGKNELESFLRANSNALTALAKEGNTFSESLNNIARQAGLLKAVLEKVAEENVSQIFGGYKGDKEVASLIAKTKELNDAITALKENLNKGIDLSKFKDIEEAVKKSFFPEIKDKGTLNKYGSMVAENLKKQFQELASGNVNLNDFLENLIPKDGFPKGKASAVLNQANAFVTELKDIVSKLNVDSNSAEGRASVLDAIAKRLLGGTDALITAKERVQLSAEELSKIIANLAKVASLSIEFGIAPPKDLFSKFPEAFRKQGAEQANLLKEVVNKIFKDAENANIVVDKINLGNVLKQMGFDESSINTQFNAVAEAIAKNVTRLQKRLSDAIELKKLDVGTDNVRTRVTELQEELGKIFNKGMFQGLGKTFETEFKAALTSLKVFESDSTQSLKQFQNFEKGINALKASLSGMPAENVVAKALLELLTVYEKTEKAFRLDALLKSQESALESFKKRVDDLKGSIEKATPKEITFKFLTSEDAGVQALKDKSEALAKFGSLSKNVEGQIQELNRTLATLEATKALPEFASQQDKIQGTINQYNDLKRSLEAQQTALVKEQENWTKVWEKKTADVEHAKKRIDDFNNVLNTSSDAKTIENALHYAKAFMQIGLESDAAKTKLEATFAQFAQFGGISKTAVQNMEEFQRAIRTLFASMGEGKEKTTLIDLSHLPSQTKDAVASAEILSGQLLKLAGTSAEAKEQFRQLAFANEFLQKTGQGGSEFGKQIANLYGLAQAAQSYVLTLEILKQRESVYVDNLLRVKSAQIEVKAAFEELQTVQNSGKDNVAAVAALEIAYKNYIKQLEQAEARLKQLENTKKDLQSQQATLGFSTASSELIRLEAGINNTKKQITDLKNVVSGLGGSGDSASVLFKNIIKGINKGNEEIKSALTNLQIQAVSKLAVVTETLQNKLGQTKLGGGLAKSIESELNALASAFRTANLADALTAINDIRARIQKAFTENTPTTGATQELANTYLKPYQELLKGLEGIARSLAGAIPKLSESTTQQTDVADQLTKIRTEIKATSDVLNDFGKAANTAQLTTRFDEAKLKARELNAEISRLGKGSFDQAKYSDFELRLQGIRNEFREINKKNRAFGTNLKISELNNLIITTNGSLKEFGKATDWTTLDNKFKELRDKFPALNADLTDFDKLLREAFTGTKTAINVKPLTDLKNEIIEVKNNLKNPAQNNLYTTLLSQIDALIKKTTIYNATVKAGASKADVGIQAFIDPSAVNASRASLQALEAELNANKVALDIFLKSGGQTKETATQIAEGFKVTQNSVKNLTSEIGLLSGVSSSLLSHINALKVGGADTSAMEAFRASIEAIIKTKKELDVQFKGGNLTGKLSEDLNRLVDAKDALAQFKVVGDTLKSSAFFDSTAYSARLALEEIQRLQSALRSISGNISKSLSVSRAEPINPEVKKELEEQQRFADAAIAKLKEMGAVYSQLNSKPKIKLFDELKTTLDTISEGGIAGVKKYMSDFQTGIVGMETSMAQLKAGVLPLTESFVNGFKQQSETIKTTSQQYQAWLNLLNSQKISGQTRFELADGTTVSIDVLIKRLEKLMEVVADVEPRMKQAGDGLTNLLGTAAGQAQLKVTGLIEKFGALQTRINSINPGNNIQEMYGSVKELMELLNRPYKTGPFFTLPKESFTPIRNELIGVLEVAKNLQNALQFQLQNIAPGTKLFAETEASIKAAREEVTRLSAAMLRLSEYEKNASNFSALRAGLHGASTTLQELAHEGAFIYKGLDALFKNIAKNIAPKLEVDTTSVNAKVRELNDQFRVTGTTADILEKKIKDALNAQIGGGGLAAAREYERAFQQLENAFVKFRSGLTQAAMGFQMLGDGLLEPFKKAKEGFEQFSDTMGAVNAVSDATQAQFKALTDQALLMGATTRFTAEQAAEGLKELAKAGFTAEEQIAALPTVMRLAQAAATELSVAAQIATVVMNEFRMDPEQFNEAADKITLAANRTLGTVEDLGFAFKYVGALAANIGADFGDLTAAIGLLHNAGLKGTLSGTALRGMLMALYNPTRDETKLIAELGERIGGLGLQIQDASGNFVGYGKIVKQLEQAGITTGEVLRFFGQRAGPGMAALLAQGSEALNKLEDDLRNAEGTTAHMAEIMEQTLKGRLLLMRSAFEALSDSIGHSLEPTLADAANVMADFVSRFVAIRQEFPKLATVLDHGLAGLALFASVLGGLAVTFAFIIVPVKQFWGFLRTLLVTTWAGSAAIGSLSAAMAFNAAVVTRTGIAFERAMVAELAKVGATAADATATQIHTAVTAINTKELYAQAVAYETATAGAINHATAQTGLWAGIKNALSIVGGLLRGLLGWWGLAIAAAAALVTFTLLHSKSVAQTNIELEKQNQLIEYSRKNAVNLNKELINTSEQLKRNQQALAELNSKDNPRRDLTAPENQTTTKTQLELDIEQNKKALQAQLKQLITQITESGFLKDKLVLDVSFDNNGNFDKFKVKVVESNEEIDVLKNGLIGIADTGKRVTSVINALSTAQQKYNTQLELTNILKEKFTTNESNGVEVFFEKFTDTFESSNEKIKTLASRLATLNIILEKIKSGKPILEKDILDAGLEFDIGFKFAKKFQGKEEVRKIVQERANSLTNEISKASLDQQATIDTVLKSFVDRAETVLELSQTEIAVAVNRNDLVAFFVETQKGQAKLLPETAALLVNALNNYYETLKKGMSAEQIVGANLKTPVTSLVNTTKDLVTYLAAINKELKTKIDEQKKIFDEAKVVVDAVKAYQTAIAATAKDTFDLRNQEIEFEAKFKTETLDRSFEEQLNKLENDNQIVELPFKAKIITETADTSGFKALSSLSGLLLDYEKKNTAEFVKLQSGNSQRIKEIKLVELNDKQAATAQYYQTLKDHYSIDSADYLKAQQEQANANKENLDARLQAVQTHLKDILKLYQDNAKAILDLEKQKKQFQASIEQTRVNFGDAQLLPTEQLQKAKFDLNTLDEQIQTLLKEEKFDDAIARLTEYQKLVDKIATSAGAQPELTLKVANLAENLEFNLDRIDFEKEFNKANIRITTAAKGLTDTVSSTFRFKTNPISSSLVPQLENGAVDVRKALQTVIKVYGEEVDKLKQKDQESLQGLGSGITTLQYASEGVLKLFGKSFDDNLRFKKSQKELETFGDMMEDVFNVRPVTDLVKSVDELDARLNQISQAQNALNEFGIPGESSSAVPLLSNISETGEKGLVTLKNVKGEIIALSLQAQTQIKPLEGLTTDIQKGQEALVGFKSLIETQIDDLSRGDKVVELPISFKTDLSAFNTAGLGKYSAEVLSFEKNLNKQVLDYQLKRIDASLTEEQKASEKKKTEVINQISTIESLYAKQLGDMKNWSKQDLDAYKTNIESKKSSLVSFLQEELSATQSTYNELFQIRANLLNKNKTLDEQYISFQANAAKNFQTIGDLGKSDSQKTYETRLKSLNLQADADAALAQGDYDRAKALLEQRQQLIDAAVNSLKPEDTIGQFFLKQDQTEAVDAYKKVTDALKTQNQNAVKDVEAQLTSVNGQILALKRSADTAKTALQDLLNKLFELSTKKFQAEVEVIQKNTQQAENLGEQAYSGAIAQRQDIGKTLLQDREKVKKEEYALLNLYKEQVIELRKTIDLVTVEKTVKIGINPDSYVELLAYKNTHEQLLGEMNKKQLNDQIEKTPPSALKDQAEKLVRLKEAESKLIQLGKGVEQLTLDQKDLSGWIGFANTLERAITPAKNLQTLLGNVADNKLSEDQLKPANELLGEMRELSQHLYADFERIKLPTETKEGLKTLLNQLVSTKLDVADETGVKTFIDQAKRFLPLLEQLKREGDSSIQSLAQKSALTTTSGLASAILQLEGYVKDFELSPEIKDDNFNRVKKDFQDSFQKIKVTFENIDKSKDPNLISTVQPLKDMWLEVNAIIEGTLPRQEKINQLNAIQTRIKREQLELNQKGSNSDTARIAALNAQNQAAEKTKKQLSEQKTASEGIQNVQESIVKSAKDAAEAWDKATPNEQFNALNDIQNKVDEISKDGLQLVKPTEQQQISALFNELKAAQAGLNAAFESGDPVAITKAIAKIKELGIQFKNTAGLSEAARQKFGELANIPSFDVAIKVNTSSIPPAKQAVTELQATTQKDTSVTMSTEEVTLAIAKLKDVENEVTKLKGLSAVEFKGHTSVDVEKSKVTLESFAQRAKTLLEVPISARDEEFKAKLKALFIDYDQFRSKLQPIKIESDASGFNNTYQKALGTLQNLRDQAKLVGATEQAQKYSKILNELLQARLDIQSNDINIRTQGYEKLKTLINGTKELDKVLTETDKKSLDINIISVGKDVVISDLQSVQNELNNTADKARSMNAVLTEIGSKLSDVGTTPGLESPAQEFERLNTKLAETKERFKEAFAKGDLNEASIDAYKASILSLVNQITKIKGVTPEMTKALKDAADVELKDYTLKVKPEVQPLEKTAPETVKAKAEIKDAPEIPKPTKPLETTAVVNEPPTIPPIQPLKSIVEIPQAPIVPAIPPLPAATLPVSLQMQPVPQIPPQTLVVTPLIQPVPVLPAMMVDVTPKFVSELPELAPVKVDVDPKLQTIQKPANIEVDVDPKLQIIQKPANIEVDVDPKLQTIVVPETTISLKPEENWAASIVAPETTVQLTPELNWEQEIVSPEKTITLNPEPGWEAKIKPPTIPAIINPEWKLEEIPPISVIATVTAAVDQALSGIGSVLSALRDLPSSRTITINTRYITSGSPPTQRANNGGLISGLQYFADGGLAKFKELASQFVPGTGDTDTVPAMLTPGEFVIKKNRVKDLGVGFLNALNDGLIQFKSAGGMIYNSPINTLNSMSEFVKPNFQIPQQVQSAGGPPVDINLTIKDKTFNIKTPRDEAKKLVSALQYLERGITKK